MKKLSLSNRIANYLEKQGCWIHSADLERLALEAGYKSSNSGRRCREMESGHLSNGRICPKILERKLVNGSVMYKFIREEKPIIKTHYRVPDINKLITLFK